MISSGKRVKAPITSACLVAALLPLGVGYALFLGNAPHLSSVVDEAERIATSADSLLGFVRGFGPWSVPVFFAIQASQVVAGPVPAGPIIAVGSALFGFWGGLALSMVGIVVGSVCAFVLGRRFGRPLLRRLLGEAALAKHGETRQDSDGWWLFMVLLLPVPAGGDAACALAGLSSISLRRFALVVSLGRLPGTALAAFVGEGLVSADAFVPVAAGLAGLVVLSLTLRYRRRLRAWLVPSGVTGGPSLGSSGSTFLAQLGPRSHDGGTPSPLGFRTVGSAERDERRSIGLESLRFRTSDEGTSREVRMW